jgi:hypothetical protein
MALLALGRIPSITGCPSCTFTREEERILARESFWLYKCNEIVVNFGTAAPTGDPAVQRQTF